MPTKEVRQLQVKLAALGFESGEPDGILGPATRKAVSGFQSANDLIADGYPDQATRDLLFAR